MERETRFELATSTLATWGSTAELLPQNGWGGWTRTNNGRGNNPVHLPVALHPNVRLFRHGLGKSATSAYVTIGNHVLLIKRAE